MSTATYTVTMAELKEPAHNSLWSNYGSPVHMSSGRFNHALDPGLASSSAASQHPGRPRTDHPYSYPRYSQEEADAYDRQAQQQQQQQQHQQQQQQQQSLTAHHSYPNLKRPYPHGEQPPYQEIVQDLRDDASKLGVNHDHKLLSFKRVQDKHTIVDQHGRIQQLDLSAQLHGMFFLSEMPATTSAGDGSVLQPELTCYRRNLFQISGSLVTPRGQLSVITETGETVPVTSTEVTISAIESVDGHPIRLIVIPWKTPPPNSPEVPPGPDQEPPALPLIPFQDDGAEGEGEYAVYPIGWRRLQFRIATANNGRRKELQQHFVLHLKVIGTLSNSSKVVLSESTTAPIVVRGRSPRNFQARKEIPLLGSSAGSRGQSLVETGLGIVAGALPKPQDKARSLNLDLPRTAAFTFTAGGPKMPTSPMTMRANSYPTPWNSAHMSMQPSGSGNYPAATIPAEPYPKMPLSGAASFTAEPQEIPIQTSMPSVQLSLVAEDQQQQAPIRTQYAYVHGTSGPSLPQLSLSSTDPAGLSVPRYVDSNPRPSKSPRHASHQSVHSSSSLSNNDSSNEYRYGPPYVGVNSNSGEISPRQQPPPQQQPPAQQQPPPQSHQTQPGGGGYGTGPQDGSGSNPQSSTATHPPRDYFPPAASWTTTAGETNATTYTNGGSESRPYSFPDPYKKTEAPSPPSAYPAARGSFDSMNHYSWNAT